MSPKEFPLPLGAWICYVILLWHSLSLPYNCFEIILLCVNHVSKIVKGASAKCTLIKYILYVCNVMVCQTFSVYLFISCKGSISSVGEEKAIFMLSFTRKFVFSVRRGFLFLWCLRKDTLFYCGTPCAFYTIIH